MSEGPEVHRQALKLHDEFTGSKLVSVESRLKKAKAWFEAHPGAAEGREVRKIHAAGKNLLWELDGGLYFHIHLLMFGKIKTYTLRHRVEFDRTTRAHIVTTARQAVLINVQVFNVGIGDPYEEIASLRELGPDICAAPFDRRLFLERLNRPDNLDLEIGPVLLDQSVAAGLGNYLKSDILFECKLNPWRTVRDLTLDQQECLAATIPAVAQRALQNKGQTVTDEVMERLLAEIPNASWWHRHWVFRHTNRPCKICGTPIRQGRQGPGKGRVTFFCPNCQQVAA
jgi:DNA-formamidopyrimidine glycosylase